MRPFPDPRSDPADRLGLLEAVLVRPGLMNVEEPSNDIVEQLRLAVTDPSPAIRERTLGAIGNLDRLRSSKVANNLLL